MKSVGRGLFFNLKFSITCFTCSQIESHLQRKQDIVLIFIALFWSADPEPFPGTSFYPSSNLLTAMLYGTWDET